MFNLFMDVVDERWLKRYLRFIEIFKRKEYIKSKTHNHHILPKSLYPEFKDFKSNPWNKAILSHREHLIAHYMLAKALSCKMWFAYNNMNAWGIKLNSILYESSMKEYSKNSSVLLKGINKGRIVSYDEKGNTFSVFKDDERLYKSIFPIRTNAIITKGQIDKQRNTVMDESNGESIAKKVAKKRKETLLKRDKNSFKKIGEKSSKTQKLNGKNKGNKNPNFNNRKILVFDFFGKKVDELLYSEISSSSYPQRALIGCLRSKSPIFLHNYSEENFEYAGYHFCYEDDLSFKLLSTRAKNNYKNLKNLKLV